MKHYIKFDLDAIKKAGKLELFRKLNSKHNFLAYSEIIEEA